MKYYVKKCVHFVGAVWLLLGVLSLGSYAQASEPIYASSAQPNRSMGPEGFKVPALVCIGKPAPCRYTTTSGGVNVSRELVEVLVDRVVMVNGSQLRLVTFTDTNTAVARPPMTTQVTVDVKTNLVLAYYATWVDGSGQTKTYWATLVQGPKGVVVLPQERLVNGHPV